MAREGRFSKFINSRKTVFLLSVTLFLVIVGMFSVINRAQWQEPYIGLEFMTDESGLVYLAPDSDGPAARNSVRRGDQLLQMEGTKIFDDGSAKKIHWLLSERFEIKTTILYKGGIVQTWVENFSDISELGKIIFDLGEGVTLKLIGLRGNKPFEAFVPIEISPPRGQAQYFLFAFIGFITLIVGIFVFVAKKPGVTGRTVFFLFALNMFVLLAYSYTTESASFARLIFYLDMFSRLFFAPLFLHYLLSIIGLKRFRRLLLVLVYIPAISGLALEVLIHNYGRLVERGLDYVPKYNVEFEFLSRAELLLFSVYVIISAFVLVVSFLRTENLILKKQLKLILLGVVVGFFPLLVFYLLPYFHYGYVDVLTSMLVVPPVLIMPMALGYAVVRYRLMDIELQLRRALAYTISVVSLLALYFSSVILMMLLMPGLDSWHMVMILALMTVLLALIFDPVSSFIRNSLDRVLYRESYDFRRTLSRFSIELGGEHSLTQLLESMVSRLYVTFTVERAAAFTYNTDKRRFERFLTYPKKSSEDTTTKWRRRREMERKHRAFSQILSDYIILRRNFDRIVDFEEMSQIREEFPQDLNLFDTYRIDYIVPLLYKEKIHAVITLSRKKSGDLFTSEDVELLDIIRLPAAIAYENASLIETVQAQAVENESLSNFNRSILESIRGAVLVVDAKGRIINFNRNFIEIFNLTVDDFLGKRPEEVLPPEFSTKVFSQLGRNVFKQQKMSSAYKIPYIGEQRKLFVNIAVTPLIKNGKKSGYVIFFNDITDQTLVEEKISQSDKLLSLGVMAAGIAHEVNTPLAGVSSYVQMLAKSTEIQGENAETLKKIEAQTIRVKNLVNRLLNFTRPQEAEHSPVNVNSVIKEILDLFGNQIEKSGVKIKKDLGKKLGTVFGNSDRLQQVFLNLLINARDAIKGQGEIRIRTYVEDPNVEVSIQDNGEGIGEGDLRRIYDPFFTTKTDRGGTGLGLSISFAIIREHFGTISVESRINEGTTFIIRLPRMK